ncbi:MAG: hypothetical protein HFJ50_03370 [Clostridia bacterium]|jgi:hypothetical protein|nr:hypothetical protein [Clostridia bacterium]
MEKQKKNKKKIISLSIIALILSAIILIYLNPKTRMLAINANEVLNKRFFEAEILTAITKPQKVEKTVDTSLLKSITVGESKLQGFEQNKLNYELVLTNKLNQITISVEKQDERQIVTGIGTISLSGYSQRIEIKVKSADQKSETTYRITLKYKENLIDSKDIYKFSYTGGMQQFEAPYTGYYQMECWGAKGGSASGAGGNGAYTSGNIYLEKGEKLYIYVGQEGGNLQTLTFNGGGSGGTMYSCRSGGGATDIRLEKGEWNNFESLKSRIMVASGGGGSVGAEYKCNGGFRTEH